MTGVAQGTGASDRTGNSILLKQLMMQFIVTWNSSNTDNPSYARIMLIRDLNDEADTAPTLAQILTYPTASSSFCSGLNMLYEGRFQLLEDQRFLINTTTRSQEKSFVHNFEPPNNNPTKNPWHATFNGANGTDTAKGHLYMVLIGSGTTNMNLVTYAGRLIYYDN